MKRRLCLLLVLVFLLACSGHAFADYDVLYCRMCGRKIPGDSRVCPYCGVSVVLVDEGTGAAAKPAAQTAQNNAQTVANAVVQNAPVPGPFNTTLDYNGAVSTRVRVTKSPTSESVPYGGSCKFIAHAANATSVTWYIASADTSTILTAYEAADNISGLHVSGGNTDTLSLSGIPSWMNGCQVQACFTGEGGPVYTDVAKIWTYEEKSCWKPSACEVAWMNLHPEDYYVPWPDSYNCWWQPPAPYCAAAATCEYAPPPAPPYCAAAPTCEYAPPPAPPYCAAAPACEYAPPVPRGCA